MKRIRRLAFSGTVLPAMVALVWAWGGVRAESEGRGRGDMGPKLRVPKEPIGERPTGERPTGERTVGESDVQQTPVDPPARSKGGVVIGVLAVAFATCALVVALRRRKFLGGPIADGVVAVGAGSGGGGFCAEVGSFRSLGCSDKGARGEQQDASVALSGKGSLVAAVCDGAGGHQGGSLASRECVAEVERFFRKECGGRFEDPEKALMRICESANERVLALGASAKLAPKSTIALLYLDVEGGKAHWVHVGDSRIYRLRGGKIVERSRDHSMVQILFEQGEVKESEMGMHPDQGRLLRALGTDEELKPTYACDALLEGDAFLLCSDGFWERTTREEMEEFFKAGAVQGALEKMVAVAVERNGPKGDNVTVLAVHGRERSVEAAQT